MKKKETAPIDHPELELPEVRKLWQTEGLFSEHYLNSRIQGNDWWPSDDAVRPIWQFCVDLFNRRYVPCARNNEAFTRQELINPILAELGFAWTDNLSLPDQDAEPDYLLFADAADKEKVIAESREKRYRAASALLEAKKVNHPLSQISKHQQRYPHQQIRDYIQDAQVLNWGILTNGNEWRLYCRDAKPSHFFCVNFVSAIRSLENFKYFYVFFSPAALIRDTQGKCRLDAVRESALVAQTELEADLRKRVFTLVEILANGFVERYNNRIPKNADGLSLLYENCLIFLYRLLFILYAEGRRLLPVEPKSRKYYKDLSLARLVGPLKGFAGFDSQTRTRLYEDILELCHLINGTDEAKNKEYSVPRYNGGLFDAYRYGDLAQWRICDATLAEVLRGLMFAKPDRRDPELPLETVDYADLRVQQLGSIYEGLLEYHLVQNSAGRMELQTDKTERKATGTYYTPDYIVRYIVEHTLGPLVAEIEQRAEVKAGKENSFADAVLALNVLDPAMGSGHFLVEATAWLAEQIVYHPTTRFQAEFRRGESQEQAEIAYWRRRVVEACIYGVDLNPLAVELAKLSLWLTTISSDQPLNFLDHHLRCGNSLIGARLDQLNELPEKRQKWQVREAAQARLMFGPDLKKVVSSVIGEISRIEGGASDNVEAVKEKEYRWRNSILPALAPYKAIADLWNATHFDFDLDKETYIASASRILRVGYRRGDDFTRLVEHEDAPGVTLTKWRDIAADKRFFHWELEFPEVFFAADGSPKENPGFDAVISNPPWGMLQPHNTEHLILEYLRSQFECSEFKVDMFQLFLERGVLLIGRERYLGMIVPNTLLTNTHCNRIRDIFKRRTAIRSIVATAEMVFPEADVHPAIIIAQNLQREVEQRNEVSVLVHETNEPFEQVLARKDYIRLPQNDIAAFDGNSWSVRLDARVARIVRRLGNCSIRLGAFASVKRGLITGNREKFIAPKKHGPNWRLIVTGSDVQRYSIEPPKEYVLFEKPGRSAGGCWDEDVHLAKGKILLKQVGRWPQAAVDEAPYCITGNVFAVILRGCDLSPHYLTAILNSRLTRAIWSVVLSDFKTVFPELKGDWIEQWPVRRIAFTTPAAERERLGAMATKLYGHCLAANDAAQTLEFVEKQLHDKRSDVVHDLLAFLAEKMMELNREKQAAAGQFQTNLKDFFGIDAHALTPKTKLDQFWRLTTGELFVHLRANAKRLAEQGIRLKESDEDKLRNRFESAQKIIVPLESQTAFTDTLIDRIVYRLYGLTPEEIRIVEESQKKLTPASDCAMIKKP